MRRFICIAVGMFMVQFVIEKLREKAGSNNREGCWKVPDFAVKIMELCLDVCFVLEVVLLLAFGFNEETLQVLAVFAGLVVIIGSLCLMMRRNKLIIGNEQIIYTPPIGFEKILKIVELGRIEETKSGDIKIYDKAGKKLATVDSMLISYQDLINILSPAGDVTINETVESN